MNKTDFINELSKKANYNINDCTKINEIIEKNFIISRRNKQKIIIELIETFKISNDEAENIYNISVEIIKNGIKEKFKHPFKNQD